MRTLSLLSSNSCQPFARGALQGVPVYSRSNRADCFSLERDPRLAAFGHGARRDEVRVVRLARGSGNPAGRCRVCAAIDLRADFDLTPLLKFAVLAAAIADDVEFGDCSS